MDKKLFSTLFNFQKKSKIKAGDGLILEDGNYPFYTSSDTLTKSLNDYLFEEESLIFGTGGKASVHYCDGKFAVSTDCFVCQPTSKTDTFAKFVFYYLSGNIHLLEEGFKGAGLKHISKDYLSNLKIPLPPLDTQKKIAAILDEAEKLRQLDKKLIEKYDVLTQSLFVEMFGDPVSNPKGWESKKLGDLGNFKNGLNYTKTKNGIKVKILGVGDFKDYWEISDYNSLSTIEIESFPSDGFLLENGDLVFVRSNGNKDLVGRCLITYPNGEKVTFSGFCIRFRKNNLDLNELYLVQLMRNKLFKKHIFKNGRGANIQNINQDLLSNVEIQLPPIDLQNQFAERAQAIEAQKAQAHQSLQKSEELFNSLLQKAFKGELIN
ncbi:restriction endonuclease subunit S [Confluentibacter citreus]|uniref:restriction endonuclease subunit S n=1 Tax=Confluentibacter citreus TaxID=2007307 RepID=UPI000C28CE67|nr:restriction endonuclease subunit S [Confluentibacter citreus]